MGDNNVNVEDMVSVVIEGASSRTHSHSVPETMEPSLRPWWMEMDIVVLGTVGCASVVFLLSAIIICYKAIKRKPLRKEENGTSRGEYAMSIRNKKAIGTNNTVV
ncbi:hypothetical protein KUCAC02_025291 [Chaenocephalus aceratus]|uniref:Uncharacterized protein n=1 Tax=Chaenocephalus aceratus TaxID=36190 RepID=A0ACB9VTB4_CHAAC|nr:hypothetical protein KUCAC02_025291 [Chaenocephalus aceratus]